MEHMKDWDKTLTALQAYYVMRDYIKRYAMRITSEDLFTLLKDLELLQNGVTVNPIFSYKWAWCINKVLTDNEMDYFTLYSDGVLPEPFKGINFPEVIQNPNQILTYLQALNATRTFLDIYYFETHSGDAAILAGGMDIFESDGGTSDPAAWEDWLEAVEVVLKREQLCK